MEILHSEQYPRVNFVREGMRIGFINGAIALLLMYGSYFAGLDAFVTTQFISTFVPYMIIILIITGFRVRRKNGGYLSFKEGLQFTFMSYVIVALMVAIGTYILYNLVDKDLTEKSFTVMVEKTKQFMAGLGAKPEDIDKEVNRMGTPKDTGVKSIVLGMGTDLIWHFIKALLITLIIRREKPVV